MPLFVDSIVDETTVIMSRSTRTVSCTGSIKMCVSERKVSVVVHLLDDR